MSSRNTALDALIQPNRLGDTINGCELANNPHATLIILGLTLCVEKRPDTISRLKSDRLEVARSFDGVLGELAREIVKD
jgi:hypothetical protein